ncbi:hypothetical protein [Streptococcus pasteurianus]|uniref:hypothetical protein n=1 Tax=Streptococcus pasteurianus TaxID=197614 RepID=UPI003CE480FA
MRKEKCTITTHKNLSVKIDYISIVFETATAEDVIMHILDLPTDIFNVYPATIKCRATHSGLHKRHIIISNFSKKKAQSHLNDTIMPLFLHFISSMPGC